MRKQKLCTALHMQPGDTIVSTRAERCYGPGWANSMLWVIVRGDNGVLREECLQPPSQPTLIRTMFSALSEMDGIVLRELQSALIPPRKEPK